jgi:DNA-directed RNA polymerase subunit beta'
MILSKDDQIAFYFPISESYKQNYLSLENFKKKNQYVINDIVINFLNIIEQNNNDETDYQNKNSVNANAAPSSSTENEIITQINKLPAGTSKQKNKLRIGDFLGYGDQISQTLAVPKSGQIIHINNQKITIRQGQPIFVSPKSILHKYDGDFIDEKSSVITLSYQQLKTGDIIQGIPKVEQFFEARTTKRGRLFRDSLSNLLKGLFKRYSSKLPLEQAVRQSFYKIQQIIVDGVQRVYRSQGVTIADKHLEVIVKQMTSKVRIIEGGQTGFFPGEIVDLDFVEQVNSLLMKKIAYEPLVLGITKASLEVDSFLSAASFQQTTRVLSKAAISRKKDFLKGLKENVILGNLIPAGTGYLVYLDQL